MVWPRQGQRQARLKIRRDRPWVGRGNRRTGGDRWENLRGGNRGWLWFPPQPATRNGLEGRPEGARAPANWYVGYLVGGGKYPPGGGKFSTHFQMEESLELQEARALGRNGSAPLVSQLWISSGAIKPLIAKMKEKKGVRSDNAFVGQ